MTHERITATDRQALGFIARFPGADTDCVAQALVANQSRFDNPDRRADTIHPTKNVAGRRLAKLARLGAIQSWRAPAAQVTHHGILDMGFDVLEIFGEAPLLERGITHKSGTALMHCRDIAAVAAQLMHAEYADPRVTEIMGGAVPLEGFITDQSMSSSLTTCRKQDAGFSLYQHITKTLATATAEDIADPWFWLTQPELVVLTAPASTETKHRTHRPDMVVLTESNKRIAVEIERSAKSINAYADILRLFRKTLIGYESEGADKRVAPVHGMVWLCASQTIKNALKKAAEAVDPKLISGGWVIIADLTNADGTPLVYGDTVPVTPRRKAVPQKASTTASALRPPKMPTSPKA